MKLQLTASALLLLTSPAWAQSDYLGGQTPEQVIEQYAGDAAPAFVAPLLNIGDDAPELAVTEFVKGAPVGAFENGNVYLIDFWATWCGPCIRSMPHLSELQEKHSGDGLQVVAVDIWETKRTEDGPKPIVGEERTKLVKEFVEKHDENMRYTVAIDGEQKLEEHWMKASGQRGIPTAMIIDRAGKVAWIGYGTDSSMGEHLEAILAGEHDLKTMRADRLEAMRKEHDGQRAGRLIGTANAMLNEGEEKEAVALMAALSATDFKDDAMALNAMAWNLVDREKVSTSSAELARDMAAKACKLTDWEDSNILDTLAWAHHHLGDHAKAIEIETKAVTHATSDEQREAMEEVLATFKKAAGGH